MLILLYLLSKIFHFISSVGSDVVGIFVGYVGIFVELLGELLGYLVFIIGLIVGKLLGLNVGSFVFIDGIRVGLDSWCTRTKCWFNGWNI